MSKKFFAQSRRTHFPAARCRPHAAARLRSVAWTYLPTLMSQPRASWATPSVTSQRATGSRSCSASFNFTSSYSVTPAALGRAIGTAESERSSRLMPP
jgi:hypothetical protein